MSILKRYLNFMVGTMLVAILTAISSLLSTFIGTQITIPSWITPTVAFITLFVGSLFVFRIQQKQVTSKLFTEFEDFSNTFHGLTMAGSGENREIQIRFLLDRTHISDSGRKGNMQMRGKHIKACHGLIEKWFKCHREEVEYFSKHPKSLDVNENIRLVSQFTKILSHYLEKVINASIEYMNETKPFPRKLRKSFETKFDAFKIKYNHFLNQFNDYIKRLNKELSHNLESTDIISKSLELESEKPNTDHTSVAID